MIRALLTAAVLACASVAQAADVAEAKGAHLNLLDKSSGSSKQFDLAVGESREIGTLTVTLSACRYPAEGVSLNAWAHLTITDTARGAEPIFAGWMVGDSPALSALDHHRYDIWVSRCKLD